MGITADSPESGSRIPSQSRKRRCSKSLSASPSVSGDCLSENESGDVNPRSRFLIRKLSETEPENRQHGSSNNGPLLEQPFKSTMYWSDPIVQAAAPFLDGKGIASDFNLSCYCVGHASCATSCLAMGVPFSVNDACEKKGHARSFVKRNLGGKVKHLWSSMGDQIRRVGDCEMCGFHVRPVEQPQPHCGVGGPPCQSISNFRSSRFDNKPPSSHAKYSDIAGPASGDGSFVESVKQECPLGVVLEEPSGMDMKSETEVRTEMEKVIHRLCTEIEDIREPSQVMFNKSDCCVVKVNPEPHIKNSRPRCFTTTT